MTQGEDDAAAVVDAFVAGDRAALGAVYSRWSSLVYTVALRSLDDVAAAEDVTQRVFTRAWNTRQGLAEASTTLAGWLIGLLRVELADRRTPAGVRQGADARGASTRAGDHLDLSDLADRLVVADEMARSTDAPHQAIRLALAERLTHTQIAERMKLPGALVKSHLTGGLLELQKRLAVLHDAH